MKRRKVLKHGINASFLIAAGSIGATADGENLSANEIKENLRTQQSIKEQYNGANGVRRAVENHAGDVLEVLNSNGYVETTTVQSLDLDQEIPQGKRFEHLAPESETNGWGVATPYDDNAGSFVAHIMISQSNTDHNYGIYIRPQTNTAYAIVESDGTTVLVDPSRETDSAQTNDVPPGCETKCDEYIECGTDDIDICKVECRSNPTWVHYYSYRVEEFTHPDYGCGACTAKSIYDCGPLGGYDECYQNCGYCLDCPYCTEEDCDHWT